MLGLSQTVAQTVNLTEAERSGRPEAIAAEKFRISVDQELVQIGPLRASGLYQSCVRKHVIGTLTNAVEKRYQGMGERITFGIGNALHYWIQNTPELLGGKIVGWWKCLACGDVSVFGARPTDPCAVCNANSAAFSYHEHEVGTRGKYRCSGHPDGFIQTSTDEVRLVELKSISADQFKVLSTPKVEHSWQLQYYMAACRRDNTLPVKVDGNVGYILYMSKGVMQHGLPLKMFVEQRNQRIIDAIKNKLIAYHRGVYGKGLPQAASDCARSGFSSYKARQCPVRSECVSS